MKLCRLLPLLALCLLFSCQQEEERYRVPRFRDQIDIDIVRYDREFFENGNIADSAFWYLYCENIMQFGTVGEKETQCYLELFHGDSDVCRTYRKAQTIFDENEKLEADLSEAFFRLKHFVPDIPLPKVSMHISGFGQSVVSAPGILSAGIDKYLGSDFPIYKELFYEYQLSRMIPEQLAADYLNGWLRSEFTHESLMEDVRLLDYLVYEGKILFLLEKIFPKMPFEYLAAWNRENYVWCVQNEAPMWERIQYYEHLYSRDPLVLQKYIGDGPSTVYFTEDSPARAAIWIGYRIVCDFMQRHPDMEILPMMMEVRADSILRESLYRPN